MKRIVQLSVLVLFLFLIRVSGNAQGQLWGVTSHGGNGAGVIFKTNADGSDYASVQKKWTPEVKAMQPTTGLTLGSNGKFYGITSYGGEFDKGTIFEFNPVGSVYTTLHEFKTTQGYAPSGGVMQATNGKLYGIATQNPEYKAVLYEYDLTNSTYTERYTIGPGLLNAATQLMQATNGKIYGSTGGALFEFDLTNFTYTEKITLNDQTGTFTSGRLIQTSNGKLYGAQARGGANDSGVVFEYDIATNTYTVKFNFLANGGFAMGHLVEAANGKLYGLTRGSGYPRSLGGPDFGNLYEFDPADGTVTVKRDFGFDYALGSSAASSAMALASNGKLYGFTHQGGESTGVFEFDPTTGNSALDITLSSGFGMAAFGYGWLALGPDNLLYANMPAGGQTGNGTIIAYNTASNSTNVRLVFGSSAEGGFPYGGLASGGNNKLYGMTSSGGTNKVGTLFELDPATGAYANKYHFDVLNGATPFGGLTLATNGKLYGMTTFGGSVSTSDLIYLKGGGVSQYISASGFGVIFEFDPSSGSYTKLFNLALSTGINPYGNLMQASNGKLYGLTSDGGTNARGVLFEYDLNGTYTVKHHFETTPSSYIEKKGPKGSLVEVNGKLYGLTPYGGSNGGGTVFEFDLNSGVFTTKADFSTPSDVSDTSLGAVPNGTLTLASNGKLYGINSQGGSGFSYLAGIIFEYDIANNTIIRKVAMPNEIGGSSMTSLTAAPNGKLYGTSLTVSANPGSVFEYDPATNALTKKFHFTGSNGSQPYYGSLLFVAGKMDQTIAFDALPAKQLATSVVTFTLPATSSAGLTVTYTSSDPTVASVSGNTVTLHKTGTITLTGSQAGNTDYNAAPDVAQPLVVNKGDQTIQFLNDLPDRKISDGNLSLYVYVSSGLSATFTSSDENVATIVAGAAVIHNVGTTTITASQSGNDVFNAATPVSKTLTITKGDQTIPFPSFSTYYVDSSPTTLNTNASSGLPITYTSSNPAVASVNGTQITFVAAGTTDIKASQAGNANYNAAVDVTRTLTVSKRSQTVTFEAITNRTMGAPSFPLSGSASSGLAVQFSTTSDKVTISGSTVTMVKPGSVTIAADQSGNAVYSAASQAVQTFCVNPAKPVITISGLNTGTVTLTSSAPEGNQWSFNGTVVSSAKGITLQATEAGLYKVKVTIDNCSSEFSDEATVVVTGDIAQLDSGVKMYPNPVTNRLVIELPTASHHTIQLTTMDGSVIDKIETAKERVEVDVNSFAGGIYLIKVQNTNNGKLSWQKFVKQ